MLNPSNLYAEKIFSEHPVAMWSLDEKADYISLISDNKRKVHAPVELLGWSISGGQKEESLPPEGFPFSEETVALAYPQQVSGTQNQISLVSSEIISSAGLNPSLETFSVGAYFFTESPFLLHYDIGYIHDNLQAPVFRRFSSSVKGRWSFISETFKIPQTENNLKVFIRITHVNAGGDLSSENYKFYVGGVTMGQWSEEFSATSQGVFPGPLPSSIPVGAVISPLGIEASAYGLQDSPGYYLSSESYLYAKNSGVPIVYGSSNVTKIFPNPSGPSLIIPGFGFLNESGRHREYTAEMWLKIDSRATSPKRVFGPVFSEDGIYVDGPFIKLKIGNQIGAHPVGEWFRPMLLDLKISENLATLLINGEQVISISHSTQNLELAPKTLDSPDGQKDLDWLGFYAYSDVPSMEVDCVAIYTYLVPSIVAKRRFAYGQAVELPENANSAYGGTAVLIDYSFADYTNNYSYPDIGRWGQGSVENLEIVDESLISPNYALPSVAFQDGASLDSWYSELSDIQNGSSFLSLVGKEGYLLFESLDFLKQRAKAFYGVFKVGELSEQEQILVKIENKNDTSFLVASIQGDTLSYKFKNNRGETEIYSQETVLPNKRLSVGIDFDKLGSAFGKEISQFLNNSSRLRLYLLGDNSFSNSFKGILYSFGFCSENNMPGINHLFDESGVLSYFNYENLFDSYENLQEIDAGDVHFQDSPLYEDTLEGGTPFGEESGPFQSRTSLEFLQNLIVSYTLIPKTQFGSASMDIAISGFWKDYLPLSYFSQYVSDAFGKKYYDLDFIQFNIDYPAPEIFEEESYNTSANMIKTYITFEYLKTSPASKDSYFTKVLAPKNHTVSPGSEWVNTKYEVTDGTIIYPPKNVKVQDLSIVTHLEWAIPGTSSNPLAIKKLQYASQAFNEVTSNPVGTRFGTFVFPYVKYGSYFDYKFKNPYRIYKGSSPYLYLSKSSGLEKVGDYDPLVNRGFAIPINQNLADTYKVVAVQAFMRYGKDRFSAEPEQIFEIESKGEYIKFFAVANDDSGKRARIYALNARTGRFERGVAFYLNGILVREPVIGLGDWNALGISFSRVLDFDSFVGGFRFTGAMLVNNVSQYQSTNLQEIQRQTIQSWLFPTLSYEWEGWNQDFLWDGVLSISTSSSSGLNPKNIYKAYTGTNKIFVDDNRPLRIGSYQYLAYQAANWQTAVIKPV